MKGHRLHRVVHERLGAFRSEWLACTVKGPGDCVHWLGPRNSFGAPLTRAMEPLQDVAWLLAGRDLRPGWYTAAVVCGRWWCVNPEHLDVHEGFGRREEVVRSGASVAAGQGYAEWMCRQGEYPDPAVRLSDLWSYLLPDQDGARHPDELPWWAVVGESGSELDQTTRETLGLRPAGPCWELTPIPHPERDGAEEGQEEGAAEADAGAVAD